MKTCLSNTIKNCNCTYSCSRKGLCCECIEYHKKQGELPACYFNKKFEATFNRTLENYIKMLEKK